MVAAEITPSIVQKTYVPSTGMTGTPMRLVKYTFQFTKATQNDWIVTEDYMQSGTPIYWNACIIDSSSNGIQEVTDGITYTSSGTLLTFASATVGQATGEIWFEE